jgi:hypothetical protein
LEQPVINPLHPNLPALHPCIGGQSELEEDEPAVWLQHAGNPADGFQHAGDGAQGEGAHHCSNRAVRQGDPLSRKIEELNIERRPASLLVRESQHAGVGFERVELAHLGGIVVNEVCARADANLQDSLEPE